MYSAGAVVTLDAKADAIYVVKGILTSGPCMSADAAELSALLASQPKPVCAALTPFSVLDADFALGKVVLQFESQPAFSIHRGSIQGGFGVAMVDVLVSLAA